MRKIVSLYLITGARRKESANLMSLNSLDTEGIYTDTKTKKNHSLSISEELYHEIYKPTSGKLFEECYTPFATSFETSSELLFPLAKHPRS